MTQLDLLDGLNNLKKMIDLRVRQTLSAEEKRSRRKALKTIIGANCVRLGLLVVHCSLHLSG